MRAIILLIPMAVAACAAAPSDPGNLAKPGKPAVAAPPSAPAVSDLDISRLQTQAIRDQRDSQTNALSDRVASLEVQLVVICSYLPPDKRQPAGCPQASFGLPQTEPSAKPPK